MKKKISKKMEAHQTKSFSDKVDKIFKPLSKREEKAQINSEKEMIDLLNKKLQEAQAFEKAAKSLDNGEFLAAATEAKHEIMQRLFELQKREGRRIMKEADEVLRDKREYLGGFYADGTRFYTDAALKEEKEKASIGGILLGSLAVWAGIRAYKALKEK